MKFALVDCNNFFCSCERVFRPDLTNRPVVVLSNNDGCVVARSNEVKAMGIQMGEPYFRVRSTLNLNKVEVFSSNYTLYADMSQRVMSTLSTFTPEMEIYSIDEAFLQLSDLDVESGIGAEMRKRVWQWCRIPVSVGIGPSKTLAKLAAHWAKKHPETGGVFEISPDDRHIFKEIEPADVWGFGRRNASKLRAHRIYTVDDLIRADEDWLRKRFSVMGLRTVSELKGYCCYPLQQVQQPRKSVICSRSFGHRVTDLWELREAAATHAATAGVKLRAGHLVAGSMTVFIQLLPFVPGKEGFRSLTVSFPEATSYSPNLIVGATRLIEQLYQYGSAYKKVGVYLNDLAPETEVQMNLFHRPANRDHQRTLMSALDRVNLKHGRDALIYAACGVNRGWEMRRELKSPHYTTAWTELPVVKAGGQA